MCIRDSFRSSDHLTCGFPLSCYYSGDMQIKIISFHPSASILSISVMLHDLKHLSFLLCLVHFTPPFPIICSPLIFAFLTSSCYLPYFFLSDFIHFCVNKIYNLLTLKIWKLMYKRRTISRIGVS